MVRFTLNIIAFAFLACLMMFGFMTCMAITATS